MSVVRSFESTVTLATVLFRVPAGTAEGSPATEDLRADAPTMITRNTVGAMATLAMAGTKVAAWEVAWVTPPVHRMVEAVATAEVATITRLPHTQLNNTLAILATATCSVPLLAPSPVTVRSTETLMKMMQ